MNVIYFLNKLLDISLCGIVSILLINIMVLLTCTHNVISLQALEGRGGPQGFSFTQDKLESSSWALDGLLEEAIEWLHKKYEKEGQRWNNPKLSLK